MDVDNRYLSTVMVTTEAQAQIARCSGVIIHPRLVLTAASCLCTPPGAATREGTSCMKRAFVRTVRYGHVADRDFKEETTEKRFDTYEGAVHLHPGFRPVLDSHGSEVAYKADLALILLDTEAKEGLGPIDWTNSGAQTGEWLVMAGYGQDNAWGGSPGVRYFRRNKVTQVLAEPEGQVRYEQQGAFLYNGFTGGPCFREEGSTRWLVGIASLGTETALSFTSILPFQDWLRAEMRAAGTSPTSPTAVPGAGAASAGCRGLHPRGMQSGTAHGSSAPPIGEPACGAAPEPQSRGAMSPTDNDDFSPPPSEEEERLLRTVRQLSPEKKRRLLELLLQTEIIPRPKKTAGEEPE